MLDVTKVNPEDDSVEIMPKGVDEETVEHMQIHVKKKRN
jgi:hypothetical protein